MADKNFVASLQKGLDTLTCFSRSHSELTVSEVARLTGATPASARRSLLTLCALGYLDTDGKHFWMLEKCLLVANAYLSSRPLSSLAQPMLDGLSERTRESASLGKLLGDEVIIVGRSTARRSLSVGLSIGSRLPAHCSALGRVLLSSLPRDDARRRIMQMDRLAFTLHTVTDPCKVLKLVDDCRECGFSSSDGELELNVRSVAVPVFDRQSKVVAGISIAIHVDRMEMAEFVNSMLPALRRTQAQLRELIFS